MRPISNVVDVTNYVMLALGNPLHAFDRTSLAGDQIVVRRATRGEKLRTLDGVERELDERDLVIADAERAIALAGIMGGEETEVRDSSTEILLEAANFEPFGAAAELGAAEAADGGLESLGEGGRSVSRASRRRRSPRSCSSSSPARAGSATTTSTASCRRAPSSGSGPRAPTS